MTERSTLMTCHFGVLIPSTNTTLEIEFSQWLPETLQFHLARLGKGEDSPFSPSLERYHVSIKAVEPC